MNVAALQEDPVITYFKYENEMKDQMRYAGLFYQQKRQIQILFILKQYAVLKNKNEGIDNIRFPTMNLVKWKKIFEISIKLGPIISKFRNFKKFQLWLYMIRRKKIIQINFIRFLCVRKGIILHSRFYCWSRALRLKRYYDSIPVFPNEDLKLRAYRAFVIIRLRKKRDIKNIDSTQKVRNFILVGKTFDLWRKKSKLIRLFNYYYKHHLLNILKHFFVSWLKNKRIHRRLCHLYEKLIEIEHQNFLFKSFKKWQSKFFDQRILCKKSDKLIRSIIKMRTRRLFRRWKYSIDYINRINEAIKYVEKKSSSFSSQKCFFIWKNEYQKNIHHKQLRKNQILSYCLFNQQNFFLKWQFKFKEIIEKRKKIQKFHSKLFNIKFQKALFTFWKTRYINRKIAREKWLKARNKWHSSLLCRFFKNWHFESQASNKYSHHLLQISFLSFCKYHKHVNRIKFVLMTTYKLYNHYLQKNMFIRWHEFINHKKEMINIQKQFRVCVLLDSFVMGSSNLIHKRKFHSQKDKIDQETLNIKPVFTNDDNIFELTNELKKIQKQIAQNQDDIELNKKYIQIIKRINQLQK